MRFSLFAWKTPALSRLSAFIFSPWESGFLIISIPMNGSCFLISAPLRLFPKRISLRNSRGQLHAGLGNFTFLSHASRSYQNALAALRHALNQDLAFCDISTPSAEYLLEAIPGDMKTLFASQLLDGLTEKECSILRTYLSCNMSLKNTADALFIHKNTLQYHLDRIAEKSGKSPRNFQDAFLFQLALFCHI